MTLELLHVDRGDDHALCGDHEGSLFLRGRIGGLSIAGLSGRGFSMWHLQSSLSGHYVR